MTWNEYHSRSETLAAEAEMAVRAGEIARAEGLYRQAAAEETAAFEALSGEKVRTRGITAVSAVSLWYKGRDYTTAAHLANVYLGAGKLPPFAEEQLRDLLHRILEEDAVDGARIAESSSSTPEWRHRPIHLPYVIDNQRFRLADVLNGILSTHVGRSLDTASAYFTVGGFGLLQAGLRSLGNFRLILRCGTNQRRATRTAS